MSREEIQSLNVPRPFGLRATVAKDRTPTRCYQYQASTTFALTRLRRATSDARTQFVGVEANEAACTGSI